MPDVFGPFDGVTWTQAQWYRDAFARELSGVYGTAFGTATAGDLGLTAAGLTVTMALGRAHVRGAGYERTGTAWSTTLATNTNANPRIDRLVLRRDLAAKTVTPVVLQGTPAVSPAVPALTQAEDGVWELPLHRWQTPGGSGTTLTNIVDERTPADVGATLADTGTVTVTLPLTGLTASTGWTVESLSYRRRAGIVTGQLQVLRAAGAATLTGPANGNIGDVEVMVGMPAVVCPHMNLVGPIEPIGTAMVYSTGRIVLRNLHATASLAPGDRMVVPLVYVGV
jgi:hypothetical protein